MDTTQAMDLIRDAAGVAIKLASPMLLLSMLIGVVDTLKDYPLEIFSLIGG